MEKDIDFTYDKVIELMVQGFKVDIEPSKISPDYLQVSLYEKGEKVFMCNVKKVPEDTENLMLETVAKAAIDFFEVNRGSLGQGAKMSPKINRRACLVDKDNEKWFMSFKGTAFEEMAENLLVQLYDLQFNKESLKYKSLENLRELTVIEYELRLLDLKRMRDLSVGTNVIIVEAGKKGCFTYANASYLKEFINKFAGSPLEQEVIKKMNRYLEIFDIIEDDSREVTRIDYEIKSIQEQMDSLSLEALQQNVLKKLPVSNMDLFPEMVDDIAELMDGVEMEDPLIPMEDMFSPKATK
jgi:hypothetical protein